ncbi:hypothetical protein PR001_g28608, partial [Phytophthora rubi]
MQVSSGLAGMGSDSPTFSQSDDDMTAHASRVLTAALTHSECKQRQIGEDWETTLALRQRDDRDGHRRQLLRFAGAQPNLHGDGEDAAGDDSGHGTSIASSGTNTSTATTAVSAGTPALQAPSQLSVIDRELKPWNLYDLSGAESPESLTTMHAYFRRFRALRGKGVEGVAHDSLQRSWCAMIVRWNRMLREDTSFVEWLEACEEVVGNYSLRDLRARVCTNAWDAGRICYVQVREDHAVCGSSGNFSEENWQREVAKQPLGEAEQAWIAKYRRLNVFKSRRSSYSPARGRSRSRSPQGRRQSRSRPLTREQRPGHPRGEWSVAPAYHRPVESQDNAPGNAARQESRAWPDYSHGYGYEVWHDAGPRA